MKITKLDCRFLLEFVLYLKIKIKGERTDTDNFENRRNKPNSVVNCSNMYFPYNFVHGSNNLTFKIHIPRLIGLGDTRTRTGLHSSIINESSEKPRHLFKAEGTSGSVTSKTKESSICDDSVHT